MLLLFIPFLSLSLQCTIKHFIYYQCCLRCSSCLINFELFQGLCKSLFFNPFYKVPKRVLYKPQIFSELHKRTETLTYKSLIFCGLYKVVNSQLYIALFLRQIADEFKKLMHPIILINNLIFLVEFY
jgi:hypothetical protein